MSRIRAHRPVAIAATAGLLCALGATAVSQAAPVAEPAAAAESVRECDTAKKPSEGRYIVELDPASTSAEVQKASAEATKDGAFVRKRYQRAFKGFAGTLSREALQQLREDPDVVSIVRDNLTCAADDGPVHALGAAAVQSPAIFGLDRIDQRNLPVNNQFNYATDGTGVTVYVLDTGIRATHQEFALSPSGTRVAAGENFVDDGPDTTADCDGHGTHLAGSIGGKTYGVAKNVTLVPVRVLDCDGYGWDSEIIAGMEWIMAQRAAIADPKPPMVANMSFGGDASNQFDMAVRALNTSGVTVVAAAGNEYDNACYYSPGREPVALTVGATDNLDRRPSFSNFGSCVDLFAPGVNIASAGHTSDTAVRTFSGSSMSTAFGSGVAAAYLQTNPAATPAQVRTALQNAATTGVVSNAGRNSPNRLLYSPPAVGPDLQLTKSAPSRVAPGAALAYSLTVSNLGSAPANNVTVVDTLPVGVSLSPAQVGALPVACVYDPAPAQDTVTCSIGVLAPGVNQAIPFTATAPATEGTILNSATAAMSPETDPTPANNVANASTVVVNPSANLTVAKTASPQTVAPGGTISYSVAVTNNGPDTANNVTILDTLPAAVSMTALQQAALPVGCAYADLAQDTVTCTGGNLAAMASGATATRAFEVTVAPGTANGSTLTNTVTVTAAGGPTDPSIPNTATTNTTVSTAPTCFGSPATITGSGPGGRTFRGTSGPDVIIGTSGNDKIDGWRGDDKICGGGGDDDILGYDGADQIEGGTGNDRIEGEGGSDAIDGGDGYDRCYGGPNSDTLVNCEIQRQSVEKGMQPRR